MDERCPLCRCVVLYQGLTTLECEGPSSCPNAAPLDRRPTQPKMKAVKAEGEFDEFGDVLKDLGWVPF